MVGRTQKNWKGSGRVGNDANEVYAHIKYSNISFIKAGRGGEHLSFQHPRWNIPL